MIALDTNVLIRLIINDDKAMAQKVVELLEKAEIEGQSLCVLPVVLLEMIWVLEARYGLKRSDIFYALKELSGSSVLQFQPEGIIAELVEIGSTSKMDLADIIIGLCARIDYGCVTTLTFDRTAAKSDLFEAIV